MEWTAERGYATGLKDTYPDHHIYEMALAAKSWKEAQFDHGHTSFYGLHKIRYMRAYWLGRIRAWRQNNAQLYS